MIDRGSNQQGMGPRRRRVVHGYHDMGRIRIPPLPPIIVMVDRSTGTQYALSHNEAVTSVVLSTDLPGNRKDYQLYGAQEGPYVEPLVRLYVDSGTLNAEIVTAAGAVRPVLTRRGVQRETIQIGWDGETLTYEEQEFEYN